ncbi:MAG: hypothetical protein Q9O74_01030 [Planctomycetota bacterium]|nr:hypothetical protein [Planctomycetota bacterium]
MEKNNILVNRLEYGWDAGSGAWYVVGAMNSAGRTAAGRGFRIVGPGGTVEMIEPPDDMPLLALADVFPQVYLSHFSERPEVVVGAVSMDIGGWRVTFTQWSNHVGPLGVVEFAASGRAIRRWQDDPEDRREIEFRYDDRGGDRGFDLVAEVPGREGMTLEEVRLREGASTALFVPETVASLARKTAMVVDVERKAMQEGYSRTADGGLVVEPGKLDTTPYSGAGMRKWRWPVFGTGLVLVLVAGVEFWRRKGA